MSKLQQMLKRMIDDNDDEFQKVLIPETDELDQLLYHKTIKSNGCAFPDGYWFVTACLKEDDEFVFGLFPLENDQNYSKWVTYRDPTLEFLNKCKIVETDKYDETINEFKKYIDILQKNMDKG